jgi:hypothetical protein
MVPLSSAPVFGSAVDDADEVDEGWLVAPSDVGFPPDDGIAQSPEVVPVPSLFCWLIVSHIAPGCGSVVGVGAAVVGGDEGVNVDGVEESVDGVVSGGTVEADAVVVVDVDAVVVEVVADVDGGTLLGVVVGGTVVQTSTSALGWADR